MKSIGEQPIEFIETRLTNRLCLKPVLLQSLPKYIKDNHDNYMNIFYDNIQINDNIFRIGGLGGKFKDGYCELIVYREELYDKKIVEHTGTKERRHLSGHHCIINEMGEIKIEVESFRTLYHLGGILCKVEHKGIINIETGEIISSRDYGTSLSSEEFIFMDNKYDKDINKKGILKISKKDGSYELFK